MDHHGAAAHGEVERAGRHEHPVAERLELEAAAGHVPEETVLGVLLGGVGPHGARLLPGGRKHDAALQSLDRPAVGHELGREMIEQFGMARRFAAHAEVARRGHQTRAEVVLPDPIDDHAGRERVLWARDRAGEFQPAAAERERLASVHLGEHLQEAARHAVAAVLRLAPPKHDRLVRPLVVAHHHAAARSAGMRHFDALHLAEHRVVGPAFALIEKRDGRRGVELHGRVGGDEHGAQRLVAVIGQPRDRGIGLAGLPPLGIHGLEESADPGGEGDHRLRRLVLERGEQARVHLGEPGVGAVVMQERRGLVAEVVGAERREAMPDGPHGVRRLRVVLQVFLPAGDRPRPQRAAPPLLLDAVGVGGREDLREIFEVVGDAAPQFGLDRHPPAIDPCVHFLLLLGLCGEKGLVLRVGPRVAEQRQVLGLVRTREDAVERVVVRGGDGIVLVVVAAGARHAEPEEAACDDVDPVVDDVVLPVHEAPADREEAHRREGLAPLRRQVEPVGGDLLEDEAVERHVVVEGVDDVVAIRVGVGVAGVAVAGEVAGGVGVAGDVEPVPRPAFAVVAAVEQPIDEPWKRVGRLIGGEGLDLLVGRRQSCEREEGAADERTPVGRRVGRESRPFEAGEHEGVDRLPRPGRVAHGGGRVGHDRLIRPVRFLKFRDPLGRRHGRGIVAGGVGRPVGAASHPGRERVDRLRRQFAVGGHLQLRVAVADGGDEPALVGVAGHHDRPRRAAPINRRPAVEPQFPRLVVGPVALDAVRDQERPHLRLEKSLLLGGRVGPAGGGERRDQAREGAREEASNHPAGRRMETTLRCHDVLHPGRGRGRVAGNRRENLSIIALRPGRDGSCLRVEAPSSGGRADSIHFTVTRERVWACADFGHPPDGA